MRSSLPAGDVVEADILICSDLLAILRIKTFGV